jgi:hypothetical protein
MCLELSSEPYTVKLADNPSHDFHLKIHSTGVHEPKKITLCQAGRPKKFGFFGSSINFHTSFHVKLHERSHK